MAGLASSDHRVLSTPVHTAQASLQARWAAAAAGSPSTTGAGPLTCSSCRTLPDRHRPAELRQRPDSPRPTPARWTAAAAGPSPTDTDPLNCGSGRTLPDLRHRPLNCGSGRTLPDLRHRPAELRQRPDPTDLRHRPAQLRQPSNPP